jgi:Amt family ammonium transporter
VYFGVGILEYFRIDDPVSAVSVHGFAGIWGTISLGLFACGEYGATGPTGADNSAGSLVKGLFYGGGTSVLNAQIVGSLIITVATFAISMLVMLLISKLPQPWSLRVPIEAETHIGGLDVYEHGVPAYHEQEGLEISSQGVLSNNSVMA